MLANRCGRTGKVFGREQSKHRLEGQTARRQRKEIQDPENDKAGYARAEYQLQLVRK